MRKIGILTGGGDCPGLNAVIRGVVEKCARNDIEVYGFSAGWKGAMDGSGRWLTLDDVDGIHTQGGTILESSRTNVLATNTGTDMVEATMKKLGLDAIVAVGGDDTLGVANKLQDMGMNMIGVPKTIDNDISNTDYTFGFDTASNITMEAIDRLHTTAASHARVIVVEIMGRHTGWIAVQAGIAGDAHIISIPEFPLSADEISDIVKKRHDSGKRYTIIAIAEGCDVEDVDESQYDRDSFGNVMLPQKAVGETLANIITEKTGIESRAIVLGHLVRGGRPSAFDRVLGLRMGLKAGDLVIDRDYGKMVSLSNTRIVAIPLREGIYDRKCVDEELYEAARILFEDRYED